MLTLLLLLSVVLLLLSFLLPLLLRLLPLLLLLLHLLPLLSYLLLPLPVLLHYILCLQPSLLQQNPISGSSAFSPWAAATSRSSPPDLAVRTSPTGDDHRLVT